MTGLVGAWITSSNSGELQLMVSTVGAVGLEEGAGLTVEISSGILQLSSLDCCWFDCLEWQSGEAGGVIAFRLNGRFNISTKDCPRRLPNEVLFPVDIKVG